MRTWSLRLIAALCLATYLVANINLCEAALHYVIAADDADEAPCPCDCEHNDCPCPFCAARCMAKAPCVTPIDTDAPRPACVGECLLDDQFNDTPPFRGCLDRPPRV